MYTIVCHAIAPVSPVLFKWIHFKIFGLEINEYNFIGLFLAGCTMIYQTIAFCLLSDLSKESGYRVYLKLNNQIDSFVDKQKEPRASEKPVEESWCPSKEKNTSNQSFGNDREDERNLSGKTTESFRQSTPSKRQNAKQRKVSKSGEKMLTLSDVFTNQDLVLILATVILTQFTYTQCEIAVSIIAVDVFHWSIEHLGMFSIATVIVAVATIKYLQRFNGNIDAYFLVTCYTMGNGVAMAILTLLAGYPIESTILKSVLVLMVLSLYIVVGYSITVFVIVLFSLVVPVHSRCFIMGFQQIALKGALCIGYFMSSFCYEVHDLAYPTLAMCCWILTIVYLVRSSTFIRLYCKN